YASHWLSEAAQVWATALSDAHRAAKLLMIAIDKDPLQSVPAERLADLYRKRGEPKALAGLLERRAKAIAPVVATRPDLAAPLAEIYQELGKLWSEAPLSSPARAIESYKRAIELDGTAAWAIYAARELHKRAEQWAEALP